jgi:hypothetical protein
VFQLWVRPHVHVPNMMRPAGVPKKRTKTQAPPVRLLACTYPYARSAGEPSSTHAGCTRAPDRIAVIRALPAQQHKPYHGQYGRGQKKQRRAGWGGGGPVSRPPLRTALGRRRCSVTRPVLHVQCYTSSVVLHVQCSVTRVQWCQWLSDLCTHGMATSLFWSGDPLARHGRWLGATRASPFCKPIFPVTGRLAMISTDARTGQAQTPVLRTCLVGVQKEFAGSEANQNAVAAPGPLFILFTLLHMCHVPPTAKRVTVGHLCS